MASWGKLYGGGEPVSGNVAQFDTVADNFAGLRDRSQAVADSISAFNEGSSLSLFMGLAADEFRGQLKELDGGFQDVPVVAAQVHRIFRDHARDLSEIRRRAEEALARANARWNDLQRAESKVAGHRVDTDALRRQLDYLEQVANVEDETSMSRLDLARADLIAAEGAQTAAEHAARSARRGFDEIGQSRARFTADEMELNERTARRLKEVDLLGLGDPSNVEKLVGAMAAFAEFAFDPIGYVSEHWAEISEAFLDALWIVRDVLEVVSTVLAVVGTVLFIVSLFVPGVNLAVLAVAGLVVAGVSLFATTVLYTTQHPHPFDATRRITGEEVVWSVIGFAVAAIGVAATFAKANALARMDKMFVTKIPGSTPYRVFQIARAADVAVTGVDLGLDASDLTKDVVQPAMRGERTPHTVAVSVLSPPIGLLIEARRAQVLGQKANSPMPSWTDGAAVGECRLAPVGALP